MGDVSPGSPSGDPIATFVAWWAEAKRPGVLDEPAAMVLSTVGSTGAPSSRVVLLRGVDVRGFVFYTNLTSHKGREVQANPQVALNMHWAPLHRQVRVQGTATPVSAAEADAYFAGRPRESQIGSWASQQSAAIPTDTTLAAAVAAATARFAAVEHIPRPPHWSGFRVLPSRLEFWQEGAFRLHHRTLWERTGAGVWTHSALFP